MTAAGMTAKQRAAVEALEAARSQGCSLAQYAQAQGLKVQPIYATLSELRKEGLLPKSARKQPSKFVAVKVQANWAPLHGPADSVQCRIRHARGYLIECLQWPPASWLEALSAEPADAAT